jgi:aminopeptidase
MPETTAPAAELTIPRIDADTIIPRLAQLVVDFGANVQEGQIVTVGAELGKEQLAREVAGAAYRRGASFVDVTYADPHLKRQRVLHANPDTLATFPNWFAHKVLQTGEQKCARISLSGATDPHLLDDLDAELVGREQSAPRAEGMKVVNDRSTNWSMVPCVTPNWAQVVFPELDVDAAVDRLWQQLAWICRLDAADPVALWRERIDLLLEKSAALTAKRFDAIRFEGPGTDLTVGLLPTSKFICAAFETADGIKHMPNIPSEEVFTTPDPTRVDGVVRATKPLFTSGAVIDDLEVEFSGGKVIRIDASKNADVLRSIVTRDEGAARIGELALVDGQGRVGATDTVYFDTLLDENAASHLALGAAYSFAVEGDDDKHRINVSQIHIDFMIGSDDVDVSGLDAGGVSTPILRNGAWQV